MPEIDLYEIGAELLGDDRADATILRLGTLQGVIDRVNAALAVRGGLTPAAALNRADKEEGTLRQSLPARPLSGAADGQAAGTMPLPQLARVPSVGLTPAAVLTVIQATHAPGRPVQALASDAATQAGRIAVPEAGHLQGKAPPNGVEDARNPPELSKKPGGADELLSGILARSITLSRDPFPWRAVGIEPAAKTHPPLRQSRAVGLRDAGGLVRIGLLRDGTDGVPMPARLLYKMSKADEAGARAGAIIERTWRGLQRSGGANVTAGDAASSSASAAGMGAGGFGALGAMASATGTGAAVAPWAARGERPGRDPSPAGGMTMPGATPDRPLYTRIVIDQSPIPTMVTNHDALTSATVNSIAQHQSAMPTAPTGMNNNLVPPAPGVPVPGSYLP